MAKGKGGKPASAPAARQRKNHGPKRKLFKELKPMIRSYADAGLLTKYYNYESFCLACTAKGKRNTSRSEFEAFKSLPLKERKNYFASLKK